MSDDKFFRETPALAEFGRRARALNLPELPVPTGQGLYVWPGQQAQNMSNPMNYSDNLQRGMLLQQNQNPYALGYGNAFANLLMGSGIGGR